MNNLLKTLDGYYNNAALKGVTDMPNKGEFIGYFIIFQVRREEKRREEKRRGEKRIVLEKRGEEGRGVDKSNGEKRNEKIREKRN